MINQAEGGALPLTFTPLHRRPSPPARFPGKFDYNLWRTFLAAKLLKMCWQMRRSGQLVKPRGCGQPGRVGESDRRGGWGGGRRRRPQKNMAGNIRPCLWQERKEEKIDKQRFKNLVDTPETSQQAEWQSELLVLICREHGEDRQTQAGNHAFKPILYHRWTAGG